MRRPEGFDRPADRDGDEQPAAADQGDERARRVVAEVREVVRLDALRRRREQALQDEAVRDAGASAAERPEPRRWALSAYAGLEDEQTADADADSADAAAEPRGGGAPASTPTARRGGASDHLADSAAEPLAEGESHAQRVDRAWRASQREQRRLDRAELADTRREARIAKRARIRQERAEVRRFTAERRRQLRTALLAAGGLVLALLVLVGLVWSPLMSVREVQVEGAERVDPAAVQEVLADQLGQPIATVTEAGIAERLQAIPQIESFRVDVVPPSSVIVHLVERRPVAVIGADAGASVIDAAGVVLGTVDETTDALPRLVGVEVGTEQFEAVATLLVSVPSEVLSATETIEAPTASDIRLTLDTGQQVQWGGAEQSPLKADVLAALMSTQDPETAAVLDVRAPEHPVVRGS
ncbi:FtsQ-type POTRA domain-containing protein [Agrococcus sp. Marseille-P2731]|uniref:FtsQ-type POTRA domain-containing protein n=1 Tax=Agrococcus sp. Marseille-P2731 TaxID=1841862 RepID=UPI0009F857CE|nr:FtsQ-type POTRA domain-containing protein [Agrococcus sp. Marseille-P2731]